MNLAFQSVYVNHKKKLKKLSVEPLRVYFIFCNGEKNMNIII